MSTPRPTVSVLQPCSPLGCVDIEATFNTVVSSAVGRVRAMGLRRQPHHQQDPLSRKRQPYGACIQAPTFHMEGALDAEIGASVDSKC
jgi:hypothetical protein